MVDHRNSNSRSPNNSPSTNPAITSTSTSTASLHSPSNNDNLTNAVRNQFGTVVPRWSISTTRETGKSPNVSSEAKRSHRLTEEGFKLLDDLLKSDGDYPSVPARKATLQRIKALPGCDWYKITNVDAWFHTKRKARSKNQAAASMPSRRNFLTRENIDQLTTLATPNPNPPLSVIQVWADLLHVTDSAIVDWLNGHRSPQSPPNAHASTLSLINAGASTSKSPLLRETPPGVETNPGNPNTSRRSISPCRSTSVLSYNHHELSHHEVKDEVDYETPLGRHRESPFAIQSHLPTPSESTSPEASFDSNDIKEEDDLLQHEDDIEVDQHDDSPTIQVKFENPFSNLAMGIPNTIDPGESNLPLQVEVSQIPTPVSTPTFMSTNTMKLNPTPQSTSPLISEPSLSSLTSKHKSQGIYDDFVTYLANHPPSTQSTSSASESFQNMKTFLDQVNNGDLVEWGLK